MLIMVGCGTSATPHAPAHAHLPAVQKQVEPRPGARIIPIYKFKFGDGQPARVRLGEHVQWFNADSMVHTASGDDFDTGFIRPGELSEPIQFLKVTPPAGVPYFCNVHEGMKGTLIVEDTPPPPDGVGKSVHSMVTLGTDPEMLILHHISLFNDPHHFYHVTLEARLLDPGPRDAYKRYVQANPDPLIILDPELFVLTELENGTRKEMKGTFSSASINPLVNFGDPIPGLEDVRVGVSHLIEFRKYRPLEPYPDRLQYRIVSTGPELFLLHEVEGAPSFQEVARVEVTPPLTGAQLKGAPRVTIPTKRLQRVPDVTLPGAALSNSTHVLLSPPPRTLRPVPQLATGEILDVEISGSKHQIKVVKSIYFDTRILNK